MKIASTQNQHHDIEKLVSQNGASYPVIWENNDVKYCNMKLISLNKSVWRERGGGSPFNNFIELNFVTYFIKITKFK